MDDDNAIDLEIAEKDAVAEAFKDSDRVIFDLDLKRHVEAAGILDSLQRAMDAVEREQKQ